MITTTTTNSNNNKDISLNSLIFNEIVIYLIQNNNFKYILEYSLLSKRNFKLFQNILISHSFYKSNKSSILTLKQFKNLINNNNNYNLKLIQFKELERIKINYNSNIQFEEFEKNKTFILQQCKSLKKVVIVNWVNSIYHTLHDYTCDGFFKIKKLSMLISYEYNKGQPTSIGDGYINYDDDDEYIKHYVENFNYSFNFLNNFKASTIAIKTTNDYNNLNFKKLNNILLNNKSKIKKIKFKRHNCTNDFFNLSINLNSTTSNKIKSLIVRIENPKAAISNDLDNFKINISENNILKKLIFKSPLNNDSKFTYTFNKENELQFLLSNGLVYSKSIQTLGLVSFEINNSETLNELYSIPNITTLYCNYLFMKSFSQHLINEKSNIKSLKIFSDDDGGNNQEFELSKLDQNEKLIFLNKFIKSDKVKIKKNNKSVHYYYLKDF